MLLDSGLRVRGRAAAGSEEGVTAAGAPSNRDLLADRQVSSVR